MALLGMVKGGGASGDDTIGLVPNDPNDPRIASLRYIPSEPKASPAAVPAARPSVASPTTPAPSATPYMATGEIGMGPRNVMGAGALADNNRGSLQSPDSLAAPAVPSQPNPNSNYTTDPYGNISYTDATGARVHNVSQAGGVGRSGFDANGNPAPAVPNVGGTITELTPEQAKFAQSQGTWQDVTHNPNSFYYTPTNQPLVNVKTGLDPNTGEPIAYLSNGVRIDLNDPRVSDSARLIALKSGMLHASGMQQLAVASHAYNTEVAKQTAAREQGSQMALAEEKSRGEVEREKWLGYGMSQRGVAASINHAAGVRDAAAIRGGEQYQANVDRIAKNLLATNGMKYMDDPMKAYADAETIADRHSSINAEAGQGQPSKQEAPKPATANDMAAETRKQMDANPALTRAMVEYHWQQAGMPLAMQQNIGSQLDAFGDKYKVAAQ